MIVLLAAAVLAILAGVLLLVTRGASNRRRKADQESLENDEANRIIEQASLLEAARRRRIEDRVRALSEPVTAIATSSPAVLSSDHSDDQQRAETAEVVRSEDAQEEEASSAPLTDIGESRDGPKRSSGPDRWQGDVSVTPQECVPTPENVDPASGSCPLGPVTGGDIANPPIQDNNDSQLVVSDATDNRLSMDAAVEADDSAVTALIDLAPSHDDSARQQDASSHVVAAEVSASECVSHFEDATPSTTNEAVAERDREAEAQAARAAAKAELRRQFEERRREIADQKAAHSAEREKLPPSVNENQSVASKVPTVDHREPRAAQDPIAEATGVAKDSELESEPSVEQGDESPPTSFEDDSEECLPLETPGNSPPSDAQPVEAEALTSVVIPPKDAGEPEESTQFQETLSAQEEERKPLTDTLAPTPDVDGDGLEVRTLASERADSFESTWGDAPPSSNEPSQVFATDQDTEAPSPAVDEGDQSSADVGMHGQEKAHARSPRRYQPIARTGQAFRPQRDSSSRAAVERAGQIEVRLVIERGGHCRIGLLPRRQGSMPAEITVSGSGGRYELNALQENWYQDVLPTDLGSLLRAGIEWAGKLPDGTKFRLALSGRDVFVLTRHDEINGFVSVPRLLLGEEHVVLCADDRLEEVLGQIRDTGSPAPTVASSELGIPQGWSALRGVLPRIAIMPSEEGSILDALCPKPEVELALVGGVRVDRTTWLVGYPPELRILGDKEAVRMITIDGKDARLAEGGSYVAEGWDAEGDHVFSSSEGTRAYSIQGGRETWPAWEVHRLPICVDGLNTTVNVCGALVRPPAAKYGARAVVVPRENSILIGASPGEIEVCRPRSDIRSSSCIGLPTFSPVWAVPADPRICDKRRVHAIFLAEGESSSHRPNVAGTALNANQSPRVHAWCEAILRAGRKGLTSSPGDLETAQLWKIYRLAAKRVGKARR